MDSVDTLVHGDDASLINGSRRFLSSKRRCHLFWGSHCRSIIQTDPAGKFFRVSRNRRFLQAFPKCCLLRFVAEPSLSSCSMFHSDKPPLTRKSLLPPPGLIHRWIRAFLAVRAPHRRNNSSGRKPLCGIFHRIARFQRPSSRPSSSGI
jgi:hypothetical protein